jgi:hypothetical protein
VPCSMLIERLSENAHLPVGKLIALSQAEGPFGRPTALSEVEGLRYPHPPPC